MKKSRRMTLTCALLSPVALFIFAAPAAAKDREFDAVVRHIETTYRTKRVRVPFMGLARFVVRVAKPEGVKSFKLATFENLSAADPAAEARLGEVLRGALKSDWRPLVRVRSRRDGSQAHVYLRDDGKDVRLLVVSVEPEEATVIRVRLGRATLLKWMDDPSRLGLKLPAGIHAGGQ
jgi:hypothetical protein